MIRTAFRLALIVSALASMPAYAQQRVFVSGLGLDTNPCTVTQPCRTFQQAYNTVAANGEIDVLDPAGYGSVTISHGISIQAHGFGGITQTGSTAITIAVTTGDPVTLNGLLIDGGGTGNIGIDIQSGPSVQILNSVIRHFQIGIRDFTTTPGSHLLIEDTVASDSSSGIIVNPVSSNGRATLNRITANNNQFGVSNAGAAMTIANSVLSNNSTDGLNTGGSGVTWLAKSVISGNTNGVNVGGPVNSYGDNYIRDNGTPVTGGGSFTTVTTQ
jgi:hypothetical protein